MRDVNSHNIEFGYELIAVLPYAYHLHRAGGLRTTTSGHDSKAFYWWHRQHTEVDETRSWHNTPRCAEIPNINIHRDRLNTLQWTPPPLKAHYAKRAITFANHTVVICNRFNREWGRDPINYFDLDTLHALCGMLSEEYQVVYINIHGRDKHQDNAPSMDLGDYDFLRREHPGVLIIHDLLPGAGTSFNEVQMRVMAGCERFISMNGGHGILCSYFGGENIIYARECREIDPMVNSFYNWYAQFGGSTIKHVRTTHDLIELVRAKWVKHQPLINILVRCHERPNGCDALFRSIHSQPYRNYNVIASWDGERTWDYARKYPCEKVEVTPVDRYDPPNGETAYDEPWKGNHPYGQWLAPNLYLNEMAKRAHTGYITYMDDDDRYAADNALAKIARALEHDRLTCWSVRVNSTGLVIPYRGQKIEAGNISGIGIAFHRAHLEHAQWEPWRRGDYRVIANLSKRLEPHFVKDVLGVIGK